MKISSCLALLAVVALAVAGVATGSLSSLAAQQRQMYGEAVEPSQTLTTIVRTFYGFRVRFAEYIYADEEFRANAAEESATRAADIAVLLDAYAPHGTDHFPELRADIEDLIDLGHSQLMPLADAGRQDEATLLLLGEFRDVGTLVGDGLMQEMEALKASSATLEDSGQQLARQSVILVWAVLAGGLVLSVGLCLVVIRSLLTTIRRVLVSVEALERGDLTVTPDVAVNDELGRLARSLAAAQTTLRATIAAVAGTASTVTASATALSAGSAGVIAGTEQTSEQAGMVAAAAEEVSRNVQTVAAVTEQMSASIREIAENASAAAKVAEAATTVAATANDRVTRLGASSSEIGDVVKVITSIAEQTNLLALNATIEAARAGEAGKGFAVVAGEVKELAQETAKATENIARRVEAIQQDTTAAVGTIGEISSIITSINAYQLTIASAVEQQTAATGEVSRSVHEAAAGSGEIAGGIQAVASVADDGTRLTRQMSDDIGTLAGVAADLHERLAGFSY